MHVPSSEVNFEIGKFAPISGDRYAIEDSSMLMVSFIGNFMVRVDLKSADDKTVAYSSRPVSIIVINDGNNWFVRIAASKTG
jgi:hypothetical protein